MALPAIVCLKSVHNEKYLRYVNEVDVQSHGLLQFSGDKVTDSFAQFEVVHAETAYGLIHLKSRYNNKYLVRWSPNQHWISASAHQPNEDQSSWGCTLFEPIIIEDNGDTKNIRLMHIQLGHYACLWRDTPPFDFCLNAGSNEAHEESRDVFTVINWASIFKLPQYVAFKGENGKYLGAFTDNGKPYLQFSYDDPNVPEVKHKVFTSINGTVHIKSKYYGKFWRLGDDDWIVADVDRIDESDASAMFRVIGVDVNVVALLSVSKTYYCKRYTSDGQESLLNAATESVDPWALLEVTGLEK